MLFRPDADLHYWENVYEEWCPNSNLFPAAQIAETWAKERGLKGRILDLDEASALAAKDWPPHADGSMV